jgi:hypothetical protein
MTGAEIAEFIGYLFGSYAVGWTMGYSVYVFKRATEQI